MTCHFCQNRCRKDGFQSNGKQRFKCTGCGRRQQASYRYQAWKPITKQLFWRVIREGVGVRGTARVLSISPTTFGAWLRQSATAINKPPLQSGDSFEVDELRTFARTKANQTWIIYAISRTTGQAVDLIVGPRTKTNLKRIVDNLLSTHPREIRSDRLNIYQSLVPKAVHRYRNRRTQRIERKNLDLRKDISRLARRTICFSKCINMLEAHLKAYFWLPIN